jgi:hypothetical protein
MQLARIQRQVMLPTCTVAQRPIVQSIVQSSMYLLQVAQFQELWSLRGPSPLNVSSLMNIVKIAAEDSFQSKTFGFEVFH